MDDIFELSVEQLHSILAAAMKRHKKMNAAMKKGGKGKPGVERSFSGADVLKHLPKGVLEDVSPKK